MRNTPQVDLVKVFLLLESTWTITDEKCVFLSSFCKPLGSMRSLSPTCLCSGGGVEALLAIVGKAVGLAGGRDTEQLLHAAVHAADVGLAVSLLLSKQCLTKCQH